MTLTAIAQAMDDLREHGVVFVFVGSQLQVFVPTCLLSPRVAWLMRKHGAQVEEMVRQRGPYACGECGRWINLVPSGKKVERGDRIMCVECSAGNLSVARLAVDGATVYRLEPAVLWSTN